MGWAVSFATHRYLLVDKSYIDVGSQTMFWETWPIIGGLNDEFVPGMSAFSSYESINSTQKSPILTLGMAVEPGLIHDA